jgi:hypothetical protein
MRRFRQRPPPSAALVAFRNRLIIADRASQFARRALLASDSWFPRRISGSASVAPAEGHRGFRHSAARSAPTRSLTLTRKRLPLEVSVQRTPEKKVSGFSQTSQIAPLQDVIRHPRAQIPRSFSGTKCFFRPLSHEKRVPALRQNRKSPDHLATPPPRPRSTAPRAVPHATPAKPDRSITQSNAIHVHQELMRYQKDRRLNCPNVVELAKVSGLARTTLYRTLDSWNRVLPPALLRARMRAFGDDLIRDHS